MEIHLVISRHYVDTRCTVFSKLQPLPNYWLSYCDIWFFKYIQAWSCWEICKLGAAVFNVFSLVSLFFAPPDDINGEIIWETDVCKTWRGFDEIFRTSEWELDVWININMNFSLPLLNLADDSPLTHSSAHKAFVNHQKYIHRMVVCLYFIHWKPSLYPGSIL